MMPSTVSRTALLEKLQEIFPEAGELTIRLAIQPIYEHRAARMIGMHGVEAIKRAAEGILLAALDKENTA